MPPGGFVNEPTRVTYGARQSRSELSRYHARVLALTTKGPSAPDDASSDHKPNEGLTVEADGKADVASQGAVSPQQWFNI